VENIKVLFKKPLRHGEVSFCENCEERRKEEKSLTYKEMLRRKHLHNPKNSIIVVLVIGKK
jgi:hypothetical protein